MKERIHHGITVTKKESELIKFILTGSNAFWDAYYMYEGRRKDMKRNVRTMATWFNNVLCGLKKKGLLGEMPYVLRHPNGYIWSNPGIRANKADYIALTLQEDCVLSDYEIKKII